jgi:hypothetical protein
MEAPDAGLEARPLDPQKVEGLGIDDVEAAAVTHQVFSFHNCIALHKHEHSSSHYVLLGLQYYWVF